MPAPCFFPAPRNLAGLLFAGSLTLPMGCQPAVPCANGVNAPCAGVPSIAREARRSISAPSAMAVARETPRDLGPSVTLGGEEDGLVTLYLRFPMPTGAKHVSLAWLVLEPRESTYLAYPLTLEVGRARGPFGSGMLSETAQPGLTAPVVEHVVSPGTAAPIRIDVTELIEHYARSARGEPLIAVRARDARGMGLSVATGIDGGRAPRLDSYWRD